jgi:hypothetical protein
MLKGKIFFYWFPSFKFFCQTDICMSAVVGSQYEAMPESAEGLKAKMRKLKNLTRKQNFQSKRTHSLRVGTSDISNHTKKRTTKSRETIPLHLKNLFHLISVPVCDVSLSRISFLFHADPEKKFKSGFSGSSFASGYAKNTSSGTGSATNVYSIL